MTRFARITSGQKLHWRLQILLISMLTFWYFRTAPFPMIRGGCLWQNQGMQSSKTIAAPLLALTLSLVFSLSSTTAFATDDGNFDVLNPRTGVKLKAKVAVDSEITGLGFVSLKLEKRPNGAKAGSPEFYALLDGKYVRESTWALVQDKKLVLNAQKQFEVSIPMDSERSEVELVAVGPMGLVERTRLSIQVPGLYWKPEPVRRILVGVGTGLTRSDYTETGFPNRSQFAITGKVSASTSITENWDAGLMSFMTLLPFAANTDVTQRFLGINLRGGYVIKSLLEPWRLSLQVGWYYLTMLGAPDGTGGFFNAQGPQIYPNIRLRLPGNRSLSGYFKFSPVSDRLNFQNLGNREIAIGGAYMFPDKKGNTWGATFDVSTLRLAFGGDDAPISTLFTITAGVSYTFCASGCTIQAQQ